MDVLDRININGSKGTIRYVGSIVPWKSVLALGIEWDDPGRGKNNGSVAGVSYFECAPNQGSFIKAASVPSLSIIDALHEKYTHDIETFDRVQKFGSKVAEPVGLAKEARRHADVSVLKTISLSGMNICTVGDSLDLLHLTRLDLSDNRLRASSLPDLMVWLNVSAPNLVSLLLNGNNLSGVSAVSGFVCNTNIVELSLNNTHVSKHDLDRLMVMFPNTKRLYLSSNSFDSVISSGKSLELLDLSHNCISTVNAADIAQCEFVNLSFNKITTLDGEIVASDLNLNHNLVASPEDLCPHLSSSTVKSLRVSDNPFYSQDLDPVLISRLPCLVKLNGSTILPQYRIDAELWFMSQVARQLIHFDTSPNNTIWQQLVAKHGAPVVEQKKSHVTLKQSLVAVTVSCADSGPISLKLSRNMSVAKIKTMAAKRAHLSVDSMLHSTLTHPVYGTLNDLYSLDRYLSQDSTTLDLILTTSN